MFFSHSFQIVIGTLSIVFLLISFLFWGFCWRDETRNKSSKKYIAHKIFLVLHALTAILVIISIFMYL